MPELPEVESIKLQLGKFMTGHKIVDTIINYRKKFEGNEKNLEGAKITSVRRFGKVVVMDLDNGFSILTHVKMTGQYIYRGPNLPSPGEISKKVTGGVPGKHTHVIFKLDRGGMLYYNDLRKFGWIKVVPTAAVEKDKFIAHLGPEPLKDLSIEAFGQLLSKSSRPVKIVIMDQSKMGGVGNIYANDALWLARVSPNKKANMLVDREIKSLYEAIISVLKEGIKWGGASELAFVTPDGSEGQYQRHSLAYGHDGVKCMRPECLKLGVKFEKYFLGGRGTYACSNCQK